MNDSYSKLLRRNRACACPRRTRMPTANVAPSPAEGPVAVNRLNSVLAGLCGDGRATAPHPPHTLAALCVDAKEVLEDRTGRKVLSTPHLKRLLDGLLSPSDALPCIMVSADGQRLSWYCYDAQRDGWTSTLSRMGTPTTTPTDDAVFQLARIVGFLTQADTPMSRAMLDSYLTDLTKRLLRTVHRHKNIPQYDPNQWVRREDGEDNGELSINLYTE